MTCMSRLDKIRGYGKKRDKELEARNKKLEELSHIYEMKVDIMKNQIIEWTEYIKNDLMPRIKEFISTADESEAQGIRVSQFYNRNGKLVDFYSGTLEYIDECMKFVGYSDYYRAHIKGIIITKDDKQYISIENGELIISSNDFVVT